ncbi:MAG: transcriptional repressor [Ruminococcaceae bacterium]|nr:transcriptional repressor [Oscillospiraceae bacterium]
MIIKLEKHMSETRYKTRQRDEILAFFADHKDECFTAKEVCGRVSAGEATVFRTIAKLTDEGLINRFVSGSRECAHYQYNGCTHTDHIHLKCNKCGELIHLDCEFVGKLLSHFMDEHSFTVDSGKTVIYGCCKNCAGGSGHEH